VAAGDAFNLDVERQRLEDLGRRIQSARECETLRRARSVEPASSNVSGVDGSDGAHVGAHSSRAEAEDLSPMAVDALSRMTADQRAMFEQMYGQKRRSSGAMVALAFLFPIQLFVLNKTALGIAFWLTGGGFGIWWVVEWFLTPRRVREYNRDLADQLLVQMKVLA